MRFGENYIMKQIIISIVVVFLHLQAFSQFKLSGLTTMYSGIPTSKSPVIAIGISTADAEYLGSADNVDGFESLLMGRKEENITVGQVFDSSGVHFMLVTVSPVQPGFFEYRLVKDAIETLVPWKTIDTRSVDSIINQPLNYIGKFKVDRGHFLLMDIRRKGEDSVLSTALVSFVETKPTIKNIYLQEEMKAFMKQIANPDEKTGPEEIKKWQLKYAAEELDQKSGLPKKLELDAEQNSLIFFLQEKIRKADALEYQLIKNGEVVRDWQKNDFDNGFIWLTNLTHGAYELKLRFKVQRENITSYHFVIQPRWDQTLSFKIIAGGLLAAFFGFIILLFHSRRQKQKLRSETIKKRQAEAELRSVYAQLNPHFIFNALGSIQGLINKNETEKANHYLSTFSKLLRDSLVNGEKNQVPLSAEIGILETYLQLEQLRFGFDYAIEVNGIETGNVEVPALFLQPLVENAIKHGVSSLQEKGKILVLFHSSGKDMHVKISDNGNGYDLNRQTNGFGLKLTEQRMALINEKDQDHISMKTESGSAGTSITLIFKNLLS